MENKIPRILVVDDDANLLMIMSDIFKMNGFEPVTEQAGRKALAQIEKHTFDIALIDLRLEDMSGLKVLSEIKARSPETECILLTGYASQNSAIEAIQMGVYGFFQKPFDMEQLLLSMRRALEKKAATKSLQESERFARATVDALSSHIAILDETGVILAVNRAWREFASANSDGTPDAKLCEGANYLSVCDNATGKNCKEAAEMAAGIRAVISGGKEGFSIEYPCHAPAEKRWFTARVTRFPGEGLLRIVVAHQNITERRQAEKRLRLAEENYRSIFENALEGIYQSLPEGRFITVNPAFARMLGYESPGELIETVADIAGQTYAKPAQRAEFMQNMAEKGSVTGFEFQMKRKDGGIIWISENVRAVYDHAGKLHYYEGSAVDITGRKRAEEAQRQSELQFRALFELSPDAVMLIDPHDPNVSWPIVDCNTAACLMNGYNRDELIGHSIDIVNTDSATQDIRNAYLKQVQEAGNLKLESFHRHKNGAVFPIEVSTALIRVGNRELIIGIDRDITERKRAEEKIAQTEKRFRSLIENAPDGVVLVGKDGKYKYASPAALRIFNYKLEDVIDANPNEQTHPDDLPMVMGVLQDLIANPSNVSTIQYRFKHQNGEWRWIESTFTNLLAEPSVEAVVINFRDITERKRVEDELLESEQRFQQLAHNIEEVFWITEAGSGKEIYISPAAEKVWGIPVENLYQGQYLFLEYILPEDRQIALDAIERQSHGAKTEMEYRIRHPDGSVHWVWDRAFPVLDETGRVMRVTGLAVDITERKQAEEALYDSEERFKNAFQYSAIGMALVALEGKWLKVNPTMCSIVGYSEGELIEKTFQDITYPDDLDSDLNYLNQLLTGKIKSYTMEKRYFHKEGNIVWVLLTVALAKDNAGTPLYLISQVNDITERKRAEEALSASETKLRALVEQVPSIVYTESAETRETLYISPQVEKLTGYTPAEWMEDRGLWKRMIHPEDLKALLAEDERTHDDLEPFHHDYRILTRDGRTLWIHDESVIIKNQDGTPLFWQGVMYDITERKRAEEALAHERNLLRTLVDNLPDRVYVKDTECRFLLKNLADALSIGVASPDEMIGKSDADYYPPAMAARFYVDDQAVMQSGQPLINHEESVMDADGIQRWILTTKVPWRDSEGRVIGLVGIGRDITERKRVEEALHASEERFRVIFEKANDAIHIENVDDKILAVNSRMCELMGYSREELLQMHVADLQAPEIKQSGNVLKRELTRHGSNIFESLNLHRDGRRIPVEISTGIVEQPSGNLYISVLRDITERKQTEENIRQRVKELELLYESGLAFSHLLNPKEIAQKIIELLGEKLNWHHTAIRLARPQDGTFELLAFDQPGLGGNEAEARLQKFVTRVDEGLSGWAFQQSKTVRSGDVSNDPHYMASYPGMNSGLYVPLKSGNHTLGVISIESEQPDAFSEADEQLLVTLANQAANAFENARLYKEIRHHSKELEQRVRERTADLSRVNADLAQAVRVKDEFLASMSHELRTPLTGILGLSEALQLKVYGELSEKQGKTLKTIEESGRHLLDLINDILDLSKIEAGKLELQFAPCSLADICQASLQLIRGMAQKKNQRVHYTPTAEPIIIHVDARRLKQLLVNLLSNAIKFTPQNGELGLEVKTSESGRKFELTVWDKGIGIDSGNLQNIFKPFVQLDSGLAREYSGTGLGLALVKRLTELHNGGIEVESRVGGGSRFTVVLPRSPENTVPIPSIARRATGGLVPPPDPSKTPLVMFADDNELVLQMVADFLEAMQYRVIKVHSGTELIEQASKLHPDIMLVDIQMPGIGGLETIRRIRSHPDPLVVGTPVIAVTALAMPADRERCLDAGANDYMSKPLKLKALAVAIQKLLERKS